MAISILWLTSGLEFGGAEMMLFNLLSGMNRRKFSFQVISLIGFGPMTEKIRSLNVPIRTLGMRPGRPNPLSVLRLAWWLRQERPDVIQTWMYHADLVGGLAAKLAGGMPVAWGIRHCDFSREGNKWLTLQTIKICARFSCWLPTRIICNSETSRQAHSAAGYASEKMVVIPNGSNLTSFKANSDARAVIRKELGIPKEAPLIGLVGRFHPHKDHCNFVRAAALLHRLRPDVHFLLCGEGIVWNNSHLVRWIYEGGIQHRCRLLGPRHDIPRVTAALDIATSSSFGESFSNVIVEAMSCEVPCVVTDVGDSARIVGKTGRVVPPKNHTVLARAWNELLELDAEERNKLGAAARQRIEEHFDLPHIVHRYESLYEELAGV